MAVKNNKKALLMTYYQNPLLNTFHLVVGIEQKHTRKHYSPKEYVNMKIYDSRNNYNLVLIFKELISRVNEIIIWFKYPVNFQCLKQADSHEHCCKLTYQSSNETLQEAREDCNEANAS